jgi:tryptophanyl-tRNA synthetase
MANKGYLESVLRDGGEKARAIANSTLADVKAALGFTVPLSKLIVPYEEILDNL